MPDRFWSKVEKGSGAFAMIDGQLSECWIWTARRNAAGYGQFRIDHKTVQANRLAYQLTHGGLDPAFDVCHKCDNPFCVRPDHLFLGTRAENNFDRNAKGRNAVPAGVKNSRAKLTEKQVREIRALYAAGGVTQLVLAQRFNISKCVISFIITRRTWKHIA